MDKAPCMKAMCTICKREDMDGKLGPYTFNVGKKCFKKKHYENIPNDIVEVSFKFDL